MKHFIQNLRWFTLSLLLAIGSTMWADEVTDVLTRNSLGLTQTDQNYANFSNATITSAAVYAGRAATNYGKCIQLRSSGNDTGIYTTKTGGKVRAISVTWNTATNSEKQLNIYGKNTAYSAPAELYGTSKGTLLGSITSTTNQTVIVSDDYEYIGIVSNNGALYLDDITIVWEDGKTDNTDPIDPAVSFAQDPFEVEVGKTATNTITKPYNLDVKYSIDNNIATIDEETGAVTALTEGTATVTATWDEVEHRYYAGSTTYTLNVIPRKPATIYEKVTNVNQLVAGNEYIIVAPGYDKAMGEISTNSTSSYRDAVNVTIESDNKIYITNEAVAVLTLGGTTGAYTFYDSDNELYLSYTGSNNTLNSATSSTATGTKWTINDNFGISNATSTTRIIRYNPGSPRFACYTGGQQEACLFVKTESVNMSRVGYTTLYYGATALEVPEGLKAYTYKQTEDGIAVETTYEEGDAIPAGEAVVLQGEPNMLYTFKPVTTDKKASTTNALHGSDVAAMTTGGDKYYALSLNAKSEPESVGFYFVEEGGAAFKCPAHRAYLALTDNGNGVKSFYTFGETEATGISNIATSTTNAGTIYNLQGQRVNVPTRGIYIVNGKKVFIK